MKNRFKALPLVACLGGILVFGDYGAHATTKAGTTSKTPSTKVEQKTQTGASAITGKSAGKKTAAVIDVGGTKIERARIDTLVNLIAMQQHGKTSIADEERSTLRKLVSANLIGQELLGREAKSLQIKPDSTKADSLFNLFRRNYPSQEAFQEAMKAAGDNEKSVREKLLHQVVVDQLLQTKFPELKRPTEEEMRAFFEQKKKDFPVNDSLRASQIVLRISKEMSADEVKKKKADLESLRKALLEEEDPMLRIAKFSSKAAEHSQSPEARAGGDLRRFKKGDFFPEFDKEVAKLKVGDLSQVFRSPLGWHLILLTEKFDGEFSSYRLVIYEVLANQKQQQTHIALKNYLKELAKKYQVTFMDASFRDASPAGIY